MIPIHYLSGRLGNQMFRDAYIYAQYRDGMIPDIYLQSEKYFEKYKDEIKARYGSGITRISYVAIHVRRGDYVGNDFYVDLFEDGYYERAASEFPGQEFLIFSDDPDWCHQQDIFKHYAISRNNSEIDDFNLMASCEGHIIANSSYSWWAAYVSPNKGKVVAPSKWFTDGEKRIDLPSNWILK